MYYFVHKIVILCHVSQLLLIILASKFSLFASHACDGLIWFSAFVLFCLPYCVILFKSPITLKSTTYVTERSNSTEKDCCTIFNDA